MITLSSPQLSAQLNSQTLSPFGLLLENTDPQLDIRELPIRELRQLILEHRLVVLRGFPLFERDALCDYCASWGKLLMWDFGAILEMTPHEKPTNFQFTSGNVPVHWDGAFAEAVPSFQFFQCLEAPTLGNGGETLFSDTTRIWQNANPTQREKWKQIVITYRTEKVVHYGGIITVPLVNKHPVTGMPTLRFIEPLNEKSVPLNPVFLEVVGLPSEQQDQFLSKLISELKEMIYHPQNCFAHQWQKGDILIADNHALLHGRNPFLKSSLRHLQRVHIL